MTTLAPSARRSKGRRAGEGSIFERASRPAGSRWVYTWRDRSGIRRTRYAASEAAAVVGLTAARAERDAGMPATGRRLTVGGWLTDWLKLHEPGLAPGSVRIYRDAVRLYIAPELGRIRLVDLDAVHVAEAWGRLAARPGKRGGMLAPSTVACAHRVLRAALNDAVRAGKIGRNVCELVTPPSDEIVPEPPTPAEIARLLEATADEPFGPILLVLRWTGARIGEVLGLRPSDVVRERGVIRIYGSMKRGGRGRVKERASLRELPVPDHVIDVLEAMPRHSLVNLFSTRTGAPLDQGNVRKWMHRRCAALGLAPSPGADRDAYVPHDFRHAFATELLQAAFPDSFVSRCLGHAADAQTTARYSHVKPMAGMVAESELARFYWSIGRSAPDSQIDSHAMQPRAAQEPRRPHDFVLASVANVNH